MQPHRLVSSAWRLSHGGATTLDAGASRLSRPSMTSLTRSRTATPHTHSHDAFLQRRLFFISQRRPYNYDPRDPNSQRYRQQWEEQQRIQWEEQQQRQPRKHFQGVPVPPGRMPPRSTFRRAATSSGMQAVVLLSIVGALVLYFTHLEVVPVSGRRRFNYFSDKTMNKLGKLQYEQLLEEAKASGQRFLPDYDPRTIIVRHVMARLIPVSGMSNNPGDWEIVVIDDPNTANAFVLPGGKVFVYSGIFGVARNEDAVATVLGHELAHNLANHHGERASSAIGSTMLTWSSFLLTAGLSYFVLSPVIDLVFNAPMSRKQESEADLIGLMLMAEACFDPSQAVGFWQRMNREQLMEPPEWVSTHPSNQHRIDSIQEWLPAAMEKRNQSTCSGTQDFAERFKRALRNGIILSS